jgi:hypothetical protein
MSSPTDILKKLRSRSTEDQLDAIRHVVRQHENSTHVVAELVKMLQDTGLTPRIRRHVAHALGKVVYDRDTISQIRSLLNTPDCGLLAFRFLASHSLLTEEEIVEGLQKDSTRRCTLRYLQRPSYIGSAEFAIPTLERLILNANNPDRRLVATYSKVVNRDGSVFPVLKHFFSVGNSWVVVRASELLIDITHSEFYEWNYESNDEFRQGLKAMSDDLALALQRFPQNSTLVTACTECLCRISPSYPTAKEHIARKTARDMASDGPSAVVPIAIILSGVMAIVFSAVVFSDIDRAGRVPIVKLAAEFCAVGGVLLLVIGGRGLFMLLRRRK